MLRQLVLASLIVAFLVGCKARGRGPSTGGSGSGEPVFASPPILTAVRPGPMADLVATKKTSAPLSVPFSIDAAGALLGAGAVGLQTKSHSANPTEPVQTPTDRQPQPSVVLDGTAIGREIWAEILEGRYPIRSDLHTFFRGNDFNDAAAERVQSRSRDLGNTLTMRPEQYNHALSEASHYLYSAYSDWFSRNHEHNGQFPFVSEHATGDLP